MLQHEVDRLLEPEQRLTRQAVHEVDVDGLEPLGAAPADEVARHLERLDAVDLLLHGGVEVLHAHRNPVEARADDRLHVIARRDARIDLDADLGVVGDAEPSAQVRHQFLDLRGREVRRRAAAPRDLDGVSLARAGEVGDAVDLVRQVGEVLFRLVLALRDDDAAAAVDAERLAERDVHVDRQRPLRRGALRERLHVVGLDEVVAPRGRGRVARVAGARNVVAGEGLGRNARERRRIERGRFGDCGHVRDRKGEGEVVP
jgi:hypothetical protein